MLTNNDININMKSWHQIKQKSYNRMDKLVTACANTDQHNITGHKI